MEYLDGQAGAGCGAEWAGVSAKHAILEGGPVFQYFGRDGRKSSWIPLKPFGTRSPASPAPEKLLWAGWIAVVVEI